MSKLVDPKKLKGFQDFLPDVAERKEQIIQVMKRHAKLGGFRLIETPTIEYTETLLGVGGETDKQVYRFMDNGERDVALRFDLTIPFARFIAEHYALFPMPFKKIQIGNVFRAEKPQKGRYREFTQCDLDIIGTSSILADIEVIVTLINGLDEALDHPIIVKIGNRKVVSKLITSIAAVSSETEQNILIQLDKLQKIGEEKVLAAISVEEHFDSEKARKLLSLVHKDRWADTKKYLEAQSCLDLCEEVETTLSALQTISVGKKAQVELDLSIVRGLGYYTGVVFETFLKDFMDLGSICSGGRYDQLCGRFSKQNLEGVGGSVGIDRLLAGLEVLEKKEKISAVKAFVCFASDEDRTRAIALVDSLRKENISTDMFLKDQKLNNQLKHANRLGIPWVIIVGCDGNGTKTLNLKHMTLGDEKKDILLEDIISQIKI